MILEFWISCPPIQSPDKTLLLYTITDNTLSSSRVKDVVICSPDAQHHYDVQVSNRCCCFGLSTVEVHQRLVDFQIRSIIKNYPHKRGHALISQRTTVGEFVTHLIKSSLL